jgi:hypothetical protein
LASEISIDELLPIILQAEERNRLRAVIHVEGLAGLEPEVSALEVPAGQGPDTQLEPLRLEAEAGTVQKAGTPSYVRIRAPSLGGTPGEALERFLSFVGKIVAQTPHSLS